MFSRPISCGWLCCQHEVQLNHQETHCISPQKLTGEKKWPYLPIIMCLAVTTLNLHSFCLFCKTVIATLYLFNLGIVSKNKKQNRKQKKQLFRFRTVSKFYQNRMPPYKWLYQWCHVFLTVALGKTMKLTHVSVLQRKTTILVAVMCINWSFK